MTIEPVIACTLGATDFRARMRWIADLHARHLRGHRQDGLTLQLTYDAAGQDEVRELVRRESECCAFLTFDVVARPGAVTLVVTAPETATVASEAIFTGLLAQAPATASGCC